jgi:hypothetical protein
METMNDITYEMVTLDDAGNLYRRKMSLPLNYPPAHWVLDRICHEDGLFQVSEGDFGECDFVSSVHIAKLSFHRIADGEHADDTTRQNND